MLSREDNELITNTNPGTPMGELFRRFWLPAALSNELPGADCVPVRVKLLGEDLIAFRDSDGRPGLVDAYCPHRGAPLFFGRNEENGLRCVYHGWKFAVSGECVDLPNAPEGPTFKDKIKIKCYPCEDAGGLIWAYMGPAEKKPPFPGFEWCNLPPTHRYVTKFIMECNFLQAMEGDYDPSHGRFLHSTLDGNRNNPSNRIRPGQQVVIFDSMEARRVKKPAPDVIEETGSGVFRITSQELPDGRKSVNVAPWMMPIFPTAGISRPGHYASNMRIPMTNTSIMFYRLRWGYEAFSEDDLWEYKQGAYTHPELVPGTWQTKANIHNDYEVDRVAQKNFTFTGIKTFPLQDIAMMESQWGPLADRTQEHLTSYDHDIIYIRRKLLRTAKNLMKGIEPSEPWNPEAYKVHSSNVITEQGTMAEAIEAAKARAYGKVPAPVRVAPVLLA
jgi:phthalate 4,5-dioxygenase oxygenase subunit